MNITRRRLIAGLAAATALTYVNPALADIPIIHGDGINDDTAGIQAMIDGRPCMVASDHFLASDGSFVGGTFKVDGVINVPLNSDLRFNFCQFKCKHWPFNIG